MKNFIIVIHEWFMESKGFQINKMQFENKEQALNFAYSERGRRIKQFNYCAVEIIEVKKF